MAAPAKATNSQLACKYGKKCYRRNPQHLKDYSHPKEDKSVNDSVSVRIFHCDLNYIDLSDAQNNVYLSDMEFFEYKIN